MIHFLLSLISILLLCGCGSCGNDVPSKMQVEGETPYVRCLAGDPPEDRGYRVGKLKLESQGRVLHIQGLIFPIKIAAFSGPAYSNIPVDRMLQKIEAQNPHLCLVLGGLGDDSKIAERTLIALGKLSFPSLVLASGRDNWTNMRLAFAALEGQAKDRVINITALHAIHLGSDVLIPIAGAEDGRYSLTNRSCGYGKPDLDLVAQTLDSDDAARRWLISWQVPTSNAQKAVNRTETGIDVGAVELGRFSEGTDCRGGIFAWPYVRAMKPFSRSSNMVVPLGKEVKDLQVVVPRIVGPAMDLDDGARLQPGFAIVILTETGIKVVSS